MVIKFSNPYICINSEISKFEEHEAVFPFEGDVVYEVLRVMDKKPLFLNEHIARLVNSLEGMGNETEKTIVETMVGSIERDIYKVISMNDIQNQNIKILVGNIDKGSMDVIIHGNPTFYPPLKFYNEGVDTSTIEKERKNPNLKVINEELNSSVLRLREQTGIYEALLVDHNGNVTEGSKSNVFFVNDKKLLTPKVEAVLPGITRQIVLKLALELGITAVETDIDANSIDIYDGAFLTGTSLHILPIRKIDNICYNSVDNGIVKGLMAGFHKLTEHKGEI